MPKSPQFTRSAAIAATIVSLGATPAVARQADMPVHQHSAAVAHHTRQWTQPRTDTIGIRPADQPVAASPAPAVPLTQTPHASGGPDWLLITIGSSTLVTLLLAMAFARTKRHPAHPFRTRQV